MLLQNKMCTRKTMANMDAHALVSSSQWLQCHGLKRKKLTMLKILAQLGFQHKEDYVNKLGRPVSSRYSHGLFRQYKSDGKIYNLTAKKEQVLQKVESITDVIDMYTQRLDWLTGGSRAIFGVIQEQSIVIVVDLAAVSKVQYDLCRDSLCLVLREQVAQTSKFNIIWVSKEPLRWNQKAVHVSQQSIDAAVEWIWNLDHYSAANVQDAAAAEAISEAFNDQVDAVYYFSVGDIPAGKKQLLKQSISNSPYPVHTVAYAPQSEEIIIFLKELSHQTYGRFHVYVEKNKQLSMMATLGEEYLGTASSTRENSLPEFDTREDELLITKELDEAQNTLTQLQDILKTLYFSEEENNNDLMPLMKREDCVSSKEWLKKYGLKSQKLQFYDALADCAFRHSDGLVNIKIKPEDESVQTDAENKMKLINAKYCDRFVHTHWKDGSVVHLYISKEKCRWYEERMKTALEQMERRVKWLKQGSRELFGTILENHVYILIDTSLSMKDKLFLVKEKIFQLMQEQLRYKRMFNFVKFDSRVEAWKSKLAEVNEDNLKGAWFWVKELEVGSSTNTLRALQVALTDSKTEAVYLLTDGRPDQPAKTILAQVSAHKPIPIHTISFNCDDTEANSFLYQLSSQTGGRFHSYSSYLRDSSAPQPFVSEDIQLLLKEIEQGKADLEKMQKFHTECLMLDWYNNGDKDRTYTSFKTPNQVSLPRLQSAHELSSTTAPLHRPSTSALRLLRRKKAHHAEQTKSSLLRALSHGVRLCANSTETDMLQETRKLFVSNDMKETTVLKEFNIIQSATPPTKTKSLPKGCLDMSTSRWLKAHSLVARRLTIMDALAPTTVPHTAKYVPILDKHVLSKVFDEVLPLAHVSGNKKLITLINPQAVNLGEYKQKLGKAIKNYERRLNLVIWRALSQEERDKFESDIPISYSENKEALLQALDRLGWPISAEDITLLEDEIDAGKTYLQQASDLQEATKSVSFKGNSKGQREKEDINKQNPNIKQRSKMLDTLRGQKVIARSDVDGFYYQGTVVRSINSKCALVDFCQGENQIIPIKFIIQTGGALPCPPLKVGDFVFSKTGTGSGCYVPAVVIATPRTDAEDKLFSVLKYNNRKEHCLRSELFKISQSQFTFSCRFIREAQMVDYTIPNVQIVKPLMKPTRPQEEQKRKKERERSHRSEEKLRRDQLDDDITSDVTFKIPSNRDSTGDRHSEEEVKQLSYEVERDSPRSSLSQVPDYSVPPSQQTSMRANRLLPKTSTPRSPNDSSSFKANSLTDRKHPSRDINRKLENLALQITQYLHEQKEQQQSIQECLKKLAVLQSHQDKCGLEEEQKDLVKQQIDLLQQLKMLTPINNIQYKKDDLSHEQQPGKSLQCPLVPGQKVLALCSHNGWYEEGCVVHDCGDFSYFVQKSSGEMARIWREDMFSDADDYRKEIKEEDAVIAPHPLHHGTYCPGVVLKIMPDLRLVIRYYDQVEDLVPREHVYLTSPERFDRNIKYILECEERWVGQAVVARNDKTGTFHLAEVHKRIGNGKQFVISWADGKRVIQDIEWIFGKLSQPHVLNVGDHVLSLASPSTLTFLPGRITGHNGPNLKITFCNGQSSQSADPHQCFGLSEKKFNLAVQFFHQQNKKRDASEDDTNSENEDSLSDISSVTITSTDSDTGSHISD